MQVLLGTAVVVEDEAGHGAGGTGKVSAGELIVHRGRSVGFPRAPCLVSHALEA